MLRLFGIPLKMRYSSADDGSMDMPHAKKVPHSRGTKKEESSTKLFPVDISLHSEPIALV